MTDSSEQTDRLFARLAEGATVTTALGVHPWAYLAS
jgi:hypothetical protein